jgi:hypothetical protein
MYSYTWWTLGMVCKIHVCYSITHVSRSQTKCHSRSRPGIQLEHLELLSNHVYMEKTYMFIVSRAMTKERWIAYHIKHRILRIIIIWFNLYKQQLILLLTPCRIILPQKLIITQVVTKLLAFYRTRWFITVTTTARDEILQTPRHLYEIDFNIILLSTRTSPKGCFSLSFSD